MAADPPNVVLIVADDLGWMDTSHYGSEFFETPNVDRLGAEGMTFTDAYAASPLCSPTRASIMTGQYPARIGITAPACHAEEERLDDGVPLEGSPEQRVVPNRSATRLSTDHHTLAEALSDEGYTTGHFGKWHLGWNPTTPYLTGSMWTSRTLPRRDRPTATTRLGRSGPVTARSTRRSRLPGRPEHRGRDGRGGRQLHRGPRR